MVLGHLVDTLVSPPKQAAPFYFLQEPFPRPKRRTFDVQDRLCTSEGEGALRCEETRERWFEARVPVAAILV